MPSCQSRYGLCMASAFEIDSIPEIGAGIQSCKLQTATEHENAPLDDAAEITDTNDSFGENKNAVSIMKLSSLKKIKKMIHMTTNLATNPDDGVRAVAAMMAMRAQQQAR